MNRRLKLELSSLVAIAVGGVIVSKVLTEHGRKIPRHKKPLLFAAALAGAALILRPKHQRDYFVKRNILITGGSRGLGLSLAAEALARGANVTLVSRDEDENQRAIAKLNHFLSHNQSHDQNDDQSRIRSRVISSTDLAQRIFAIEADVTSPDEFARAAELSCQKFGTIDTIINNAGSIVVGPLATMGPDDFQAQLKLHLFAPLTSISLLKKYRSRAKPASLINIASIGAKIPVPHMATYTASKFALAGLSSVAAGELSRDGIDVLTAYPGLMRTGSAIQAVFKGDIEKEFLWFATSANAPLISKPASRAAVEVLNAAAAQQSEVVIGWPAKLGSFMFSNFPELTQEMLKLSGRFLPLNEDKQTAVGEEARGLFDETMAQKKWKAVREIEINARSSQNQIAKHGATFNEGLS